MLNLGRFFKHDQAPTVEGVADRLLRELRESERAEARSLLIEQILPMQLAGLSEHPNPTRLADIVYERLVDEVRAASPEHRREVLRTMAFRTRIRELDNAAMALAIARYLKDHPAAAAAAAQWIDAKVKRWLAASVSEIEAEASRRLAQLAEWKSRAEADFPDVWDKERVTYLNTQLTLQSAHSGAFGSAAGKLQDFLRDVGAEADALDLH